MKIVCESFNNVVSSRYKKFNNNKNEDGVSLLELIIAISIMIILTTTISSIYGIVSNNARDAAVEKAATDVLRGAMLFASDGLKDTNPEDAGDRWMESSGGKITVTTENVDGEIVVTASYNGKNNSITRKGDPYGSTCVDGILIGSGRTGEPCVTGEDDSQVPGPIIGDFISRLTYKCDTTISGYLALGGIQDGTKITMVSSIGEKKLVKYSQKEYINIHNRSYTDQITEKVTMKAGVKYSVVVNGKFDRLTTPIEAESYNSNRLLNNKELANCLISVDKLGENSEVSELRSFGGDNLKSVPDSLPISVTSLESAFREAYVFNDPNINKWDISNVTRLYYTFGLAKEFNQPLTNWNTSSVNSMYAMFYEIQVFNQDLSHFNTGLVTNMSSMFTNNKSMSEDNAESLKDWDTSNVTEMRSMFQSATFNPNVTNWDVGKVKNFSSTFYNTTNFNRDVSKWNTSSATNMERMFRSASMFNRYIGRWDTSNVTNMKEMFSYTRIFNQNVSGWNVAKVDTFTDFNKDAAYLTNEKIPEKFR